jgi:tetratricopeptide (TPR) repeat protein
MKPSIIRGLGLQAGCPLLFVALAVGQEAGTEFAQGVSEFRAGHYAEAEKIFAHVEAQSPATTDALLFQGKALIHLDNQVGAEEALRKYLRVHADSSDALYLLGFVLHRRNLPRESLEVYTRAAAIARPTSDDLKIVGLNYILLNDYGNAITWLKKAVEFDQKNQDAWYYLGRAYYSKSMLEEARAAFLKVLEFNPEDARAENNLGLVLETSGQTAAALDSYRKAIAWQEKSGKASEQPYVNLGNLLLEQGESKEALLALEKAVAIAPENAFCRMKLGVAYRQAGRLEDSRRELEHAVQLDHDNPAVHYQLGRVYKDLKILDRAQAEFERTEELKRRGSGVQGPER